MVSRNKKIKVGFFIGNLQKGGAERIVSRLLTSLGSQFEVHYILGEEKIDYPVAGEGHSLGIDFSKKGLGGIQESLKGLWRLYQLKKKLKLDACVSFLNGANLFNILTPHSGKTIISVRTLLSASHREKELWGKIYNLIICVLYPLADKIVAATEAMKEDLVKNYFIRESKVNVVHNFIDFNQVLSEQNQALGEYDFLKEKKFLIAVGRLHPAKNLDSFLEVFSKVKQEKKDLSFVILGDGQEKQNLLETCRSLNLETSLSSKEDDADVYFLGNTENPFKYLMYAQAFVLSSTREGFPNALLEAMACRVPVITSNFNNVGVYEIIKNKMGEKFILNPPSKENIKLWMSKTLLLLDMEIDQKNEMIESNFNDSKKFSSESVLNRWEEILSL
ncbi:MAG: glycosyltransferase [Halobacteriovoraceae bacterium]|nr:glycosyltransferase [Halobacteriovoraceae bacterium]